MSISLFLFVLACDSFLKLVFINLKFIGVQLLYPAVLDSAVQ